MGMPLKLLQKTITLEPKDRPHRYSSRKVPPGHPMFGRYDFVVDPARGPCEVVATGSTSTRMHVDPRSSLRSARGVRTWFRGLTEFSGWAFLNFEFDGADACIDSQLSQRMRSV